MTARVFLVSHLIEGVGIPVVGLHLRMILSPIFRIPVIDWIVCCCSSVTVGFPGGVESFRLVRSVLISPCKYLIVQLYVPVWFLFVLFMTRTIPFDLV